MKRSTGYATEKRNKILEYLVNHKDVNVSVKDIERHLEVEGMSANITTIYRYLEKLETDGKVLKRIDEKGSKSTFQYVKPDATCHNHLHMKCSGCGKIYHMDCGFMKEFQNHIFEHHHFELECKTSMLYGMCENCRKVC